MSRFFIIAGLCALASFNPLGAQGTAELAGANPAELVRRSWESPSASEKLIIRAQLAEAYPDQVEGHFARGYLAGLDGRREEQIASYRRALELDPQHVYTLSNLGRALQSEDPGEAVEVLERSLEIEPSFAHYSSIRFLYFHVKDQFGPRRAEAILGEWRENLGDVWILDFIVGVDAQVYGRDYSEAERLFESAIEKGADDFEVFERLVDVRLDHLSDANTTDRASLMTEPFRTYIQRTGDEYRPAMEMARRLDRTFDASPSEVASAYLRAFRSQPTGEAMLEAGNAVEWRGEWVPRLEAALSRMAEIGFPDHYLLLRRLAMEVAWKGDLERADSLFTAAIAGAPTPAEAARHAVALVRRLVRYHTFDYGRAERLLAEYIGQGVPVTDLHLELYRVQRETGEFRRALRTLERYQERLSNPAMAWFRARRSELERYLAQDRAAERFHARNPFLGYWRTAFDGRDRVAVPFAAGSSEISPAGMEMLERVARLLSENGAEDWVFALEGYADAGEDAGLAEERARSARRLLYERFGVPLSRTQVSSGAGGQGGWSAARAGAGSPGVEVFPLGNLADPQVSATTTLDPQGHLVLSPDGRLLALRADPIQLWDARRGVRLRDLSSGGARAFSPDGRYLASVSAFTESDGADSYLLQIHDVRTGLVVARQPSTWRLSGFAWARDGERLAFVTRIGTLGIFDVLEGRTVASTRISATTIAGMAVWSRDGEWIAAAQAQGGAPVLFDPGDLKRIRELEGAVDWPHAMAETSDGRYLLVADNRRRLTVWDTETWEARSMSLPILPKRIVPHPTRPEVLLDDFGRAEAPYGLARVDYERMEVLAVRDVPLKRTDVAYTPDGSALYAESPEGVDMLDPDSLGVVREIRGATPRGLQALADTALGYLVARDEAGVHVWSVERGARIHTWPGEDQLLGPVLEGQPGEFLTRTKVEEGGRETTVVHLRRNHDFTTSTMATLDFDVQTVTVRGDRVAFAGVPFGGSAAREGIVEVFDLDTGDRTYSVRVPLITDRRRYRGLFDTGFTDLDLSPEGADVIFSTYWQDGFGHPRTHSEKARIIDLESGEELQSIDRGRAVRAVAFHAGDPGLVEVATGSSTGLYERESGRYTDRSLDHGGLENLVEVGGHRVLWTGNEWRLSGPAAEVHHSTPYETVAVTLFPRHNLMVTLNVANEIGFHDLRTGERRLTIVHKNGGEWIAFTPSGDYTASLLGEERVFWSLGDRMLPFSALRARFERPDLISEMLASIRSGTDRGHPEVGPNLAGEAFGEDYRFEAITASGTETSATSLSVEFAVEKSHPDVPDPALRFRHQGVELGSDSGRGATVVGRDGTVVRYRRPFELAHGLNLIDVDYEAGGAVRRGITLRLHRTDAEVAAAPRLFFLGIGASDYALEEYDLSYAHRDVEEVARAFQDQEGTVYEEVRTLLLQNEEATRNNIQEGLHEFLRLASSDDMVVIYVAGHGVQDTDQTLYFIPHEGDPARPYTGLRVSELHDFLSRRPPTQKALVFMDICHGGAVGQFATRGLEMPVADEIVRTLARGTGVVVLSSSTGREVSLEGSEFRGGHGAFSAAVLEALADGRTEIQDGDGKVTLHELQNYVSRRVPEMTGGVQHPMTVRMENFRDFPIARLEPSRAGGDRR